MTDTTRPAWLPLLVEPPGWLTPWDANRCYVLFDEVACNIPRWGAVGEYGAWDHARGLLVELCRFLSATPVSLHYREVNNPNTGQPCGIEVTAVADRSGRRVEVVSRGESAPYGQWGDYWRLSVNGHTSEDWCARYPPSLPFIANLVHRYLNTEPDTQAAHQ